MPSDMDDFLSGAVRPPNIPAHWLGTPTSSGPGWRWDDPAGGNSVRLFRGDAEPFVVVVRHSQCLGRDGAPLDAETSAAMLERYT